MIVTLKSSVVAPALNQSVIWAGIASVLRKVIYLLRESDPITTKVARLIAVAVIPARGENIMVAKTINPRKKNSASPKMPVEDNSLDRKSTRLNSSHQLISYAVFCLKKKKKKQQNKNLKIKQQIKKLSNKVNTKN